MVINELYGKNKTNFVICKSVFCFCKNLRKNAIFCKKLQEKMIFYVSSIIYLSRINFKNIKKMQKKIDYGSCSRFLASLEMTIVCSQSRGGGKCGDGKHYQLVKYSLSPHFPPLFLTYQQSHSEGATRLRNLKQITLTHY